MSENGKARHGPGTIGVIAGERGSYTAFWAGLIGLIGAAPIGTGCQIAMSADISGNCNTICRGHAEWKKRRGVEDSWLLIMGDDHLFDPGLIYRLLDADKDVVVPHCLKRNPPWDSVVFSHQDENEHHVMADLGTELTQIHAAGSAGMLVRDRVLEAVGDPWFTPAPDAQGLNEDLHFCQKVREAGFEIWCDPGALLGHISHYSVWPRFDGEHWQIEHVFDQNTRIPINRVIGEPVPA